jgi:hypothetical protein
MSELDDVARQRTAVNLNSRKRCVLKDIYESEGAAAEDALGPYFGYVHKTRGDILGGDNGIDAYFVLSTPLGQREFTVDVKATEPHGRLLIVEVGQVKADIYILAHYWRQTGDVRFLGWVWAASVRKAPIRQRTKLNHELDKRFLRPMHELTCRFISGRAVTP